MYRGTPTFFPEEKPVKPGVRYIAMEISSSDIPELYRGFHDISKTMFNVSQVLLGLFGHRLPERVTMEDIRLHKLTNLKDDAHMFAMSVDKQIAKDWGDDNFITIDPTLFREFLIDVDKTYQRHQLVFPGRFAREKEHLSLGILSCSIKRVTLHAKEIPNPFYLDIQADNQAALEAFKTLYHTYLTLLRELQSQRIDEDAQTQLVGAFLDAYLAFYDRFAVDNPMNKTLAELAHDFPDFVRLFKEEMTALSDKTCFRELLLSNIKTLVETHPYAKTLLEAKQFNPAEAVTVYDDPYAYGGSYD